MNLVNTIKNFYRRPMRKGAMLDWNEAKTHYFLVTLSIGLILLFSISAYWDEDPLSMLAVVSWSLSGLFLFFLTLFVAGLYGYHHRDSIDPQDEVPIDLSKAYLGGLLAAIFAPIVRAIIDYFGG